MGVFILNLTMTVTAIWIVYKYGEIFLIRRKIDALSAMAWSMFGIYQMVSLYYYGGSIWRTIINVAILLLISVCGYQKAGIIKIFLVLILCVVWVLVEMMIYYIASGLPMERQQFNMVGIVVSRMLMTVIVYLLSVFWKRADRGFIPVKYYCILLIFPSGSIYIAMNEFFSREYSHSDMVPMGTFSILLLFNIMIFELYSKLSKIFIYDKEKTVYAQQLYSMSRGAKEQKKKMEEFHEEKHNLINELTALRNSIANSEKEKVIDCLNEIINNFDIGEEICNSGNATVDVLINYKYAVAKEVGIEFKLKIFIPEELPFEQCDIGIVVGNAIDNAIEAVSECKNHKKIINIAMRIKKEELVLKIKNPYEHTLRIDKAGNLSTTKREGERHGYGLNSIKRVVEEYDGETVVETDNDNFSLTVIMKLGDFDSKHRNFDR